MCLYKGEAIMFVLDSILSWVLGFGDFETLSRGENFLQCLLCGVKEYLISVGYLL